MRRVVLDTSVLVAGLRSRRGASFRILSKIGSGEFQGAVSVPLLVEYEAVLKKQSRALGHTRAQLDAFLDYICQQFEHREIYFLWRPLLPDPGDDMLLELAVEAQCKYIITHNVRDFAGSERLGVRAVRPQDFLRLLEVPR